MENVVFITGNQSKADYLANYLGHPVDHIKVDLDEIQSLDLQEVVRHKLLQAYKEVQRPVLVEDVSLEFLALGRLPGTFVRWFIDELSLAGLCDLLKGKERSAKACCIFGYYNGQQEVYFEGGSSGRISEKPCGTGGYGWDQIYIPDGYALTRAQLDEADYRATYVAIKPFDKIKEFLRNI